MAASFITFVTILIYGHAINHRQWSISNPAPTGTQWFSHHVDQMLVEYETNYLAPNNLPPLIPWQGQNAHPTTPSPPIPASLLTFAGISNENDLGVALRNYLNVLGSSVAAEIGMGMEKAPFSYRYWGYMKWAWELREKFNLRTVIPQPIVYDRDGTILSPVPFLEILNPLHYSWHSGTPCSPRIITPTFTTTAGQMCRRTASLQGQDFIDFHRDHNTIFNRWYARSGLSPVIPVNMANGWPTATDATNDPTVTPWTEPSSSSGPTAPYWITMQGDDTDLQLKSFTNVDTLGFTLEGGFHVSGHGANTDIYTLAINNFSPRFFNWHGIVDHQRYWREPRFATWDFGAHYRNRVFKLVQQSGADLAYSFNALTIVRDLAFPSDYVSPVNTIQDLDFFSGAGKLKWKFTARDEYGRPLVATFVAEVFQDAGTTETLIESVTKTVNIGGASPIPLETDFIVDFEFSQAFLSDDPSRGNPAVGFAYSRIKVTGTLEVAGGIDPGFIHTDYEEIYLVQEKRAPTIEAFLDISTFSLNQVTSQWAITPSEARFHDVLIVYVQDRTLASRILDFPSTVADGLKGLITGHIPASGLFPAPAFPDVKIWEESSDTEFVGFYAELSSGPILEDPSLSPNLPQRYTFFYDIVFTPGTNAFAAVTTTVPAFPRIMIPASDRSGNGAVKYAPLTLLVDAAPYMRDGDPSWLSIDTRVFKLNQGQSKFGATLTNPNTFITAAINNLNNAISPDSFDGLPVDQPGSVLEFSTSVGGTNVFNFAMAKVRLQGISGATNVRAFFRLFTYSAANLVFDSATSYPTFVGATKSTPTYGFFAATAGSDTISIPFFASPRVPFTQSIEDQIDALNVKNFPTGAVNEQVLYFGVYLDINQNTATSKAPPSYIAGHPNGPFAAPEVLPIRDIIHDAHQCMVVEIRFDGNPTPNGATPALSSNLAQRNLLILETDNPGSLPTHTVQHSFHVDLRKSVSRKGINVPWNAPSLIDIHLREKILMDRDMQLKFERNEKEDAESFVNKTYPLVFNYTSDAVTTDYFDELLIKWPRNPALPNGTRAEIYLPNIAVGRAINLRNIRHAPGDVKFVDAHTLELTVPPQPAKGDESRQGVLGVTHVPIPYESGDELQTAGIITIYLPDGIVEGMKWKVDVLQVRGGGPGKVLGGFQIKVNTTKARYGAMLDAELRLLSLLFQRLSLTNKTSIWYKVLDKRVTDTRIRAFALANATGVQITDPTTTRSGRILAGRNIRVVLDQVRMFGAQTAQFVFQSLVLTSDNDGKSTQVTYPTLGSLAAGGCPTVINPTGGLILFEGYVNGSLYVEIRANKTTPQTVELPRTSCACNGFCYPTQSCISNVCTSSNTITLPIYGKIFTGDIANFVGSYSSADVYPDNLRDTWGVSYHIEYL